MAQSRGSRPSAEGKSPRVATTGRPSGPLSYAIAGQMTVQPPTHGAKAKMTSKYPGKK